MACSRRFLPVPRWLGPSPAGLPTLVARTQWSRSAAISLPTILSDSPFAYTSAVSMKFTPASRAEATMRADSA